MQELLKQLLIVFKAWESGEVKAETAMVRIRQLLKKAKVI